MSLMNLLIVTSLEEVSIRRVGNIQRHLRSFVLNSAKLCLLFGVCKAGESVRGAA